MVKLSAKIHYSLRALVALAHLYSSQKHVCVNELAKQQGVSAPFLLQLMTRLRGAKIVASVRGATGGYVLKRAPQDISLWDVVVAVEGANAGFSIDHSLFADDVDRVIADIWGEMNTKTQQMLSRVTVADILKQTLGMKTFVYAI